MSKKILVVEDEDAIRELISARLTAAGYMVSQAANGVDGLKKIKSSPPDLVISDILMPEMDGFELFKALKKDPSTEKIPVIILTARGKMMDTFQSFGVAAFIPKPFNAEELLRQTGNILNVQVGPAAPAVSATPVAPVSAAPTSSGAKPIVNPGTGKLAVLFSSEKTITSEMTEELKSQQYRVTVITDEVELLYNAAQLKPELFLLQINQPMTLSLDQIVLKLTDSLPVNDKRRIILFKVDEGVDATSSITAETAAIENLVQTCIDNGAAGYMGDYARISFLRKIKSFLS